MLKIKSKIGIIFLSLILGTSVLAGCSSGKKATETAKQTTTQETK